MKRKILLADDEPDFTAMLRMRLEARDFAVTVVQDGNEALRQIKRERPDLVFLDVLMPGMNGLNVLARLRSASETRSIPVVMLTGEGGTNCIMRAQRMGASDYLLKPFDPGDLTRVLGRFVGDRRTAVPALA